MTHVSSPSKPAPSILLTELDHRRLRGLIEVLRGRGDDATLDALEGELERAAVVAAEAIPPTVVTMSSTVELEDTAAAEPRSLTLVFPGAAPVGGGHVSVLSPIGTALLGARVGDEVTWATPKGRRRARVLRVNDQPAASGRER